MAQQVVTGEWIADNKDGLRGRSNDWLPLARISILAREPRAPTKEAEDMTAVRSISPSLTINRSVSPQVPRRYGRVKASPPSAVRCAQP